MDIRQHSSQFTIFVFTMDVDMGAPIKVALSQAGYDAYYIQDPEVLENTIKENAPHILVFSTQALQGSLADFVEHLRKINDEIKMIAMASLEQFETLAQYGSNGFADVVSENKVSIDQRVLWSVDRVCEKIYLTYQNEQLFDDLQEARAAQSSPSLAEAGIAVSSEKPTMAGGESTAPISPRIGDYRSVQSKEDIIQKYLNHIPQMVCLFFKFLPTVRSFVATHAIGVPAADIQGVGVQLESADMKDLGAQLAVGLLPVKFMDMLTEAFHFQPPKALPLYAHNNLEGVFVYSGDMSAPLSMALTEEFSLMSLCYSNLALEKRVDTLEVQDFVTELFNRNYYHKILDEEVSRARRLKQPLSVVKVALDDIYEIESSMGEAVRDELLRSVAAIITKTSRTNDVTCRTAANEMALILPHAAKKGAAIRAERLRRIIEGTSFMDNGMKVSISLGVSEFPTLCDSARSLDETASKALLHITDKGGNKICLYKAPETHKPEYQIPAE